MDESVYSTEKISTGLAVSLETDQSSTRQFTILIRYLGAFDSLQEIAVFPIVPLLNHFAVGTASKEEILRLTYMPEVLYIDLTRQMEYEQAVQAEKLAFLTDIEGVYKDPADKSTLISELTVSEARELIADGFIGGGMLPKLNNCMEAIEKGVSRVHILDGRIAHCLLLEIFTNKGIGTAILDDKEKKFNHE